MERLDREDTMRRGGGLVRIAVEPDAAPHRWSDYRRLTGADQGTAEALAAARAQGSDPGRWRFALEAVPFERWPAVEVWHEGAWTDVPLPESAGAADNSPDNTPAEEGEEDTGAEST